MLAREQLARLPARGDERAAADALSDAAQSALAQVQWREEQKQQRAPVAALVADSLTGQDAVNLAKSFNDRVGITGIVLTRKSISRPPIFNLILPSCGKRCSAMSPRKRLPA